MHAVAHALRKSPIGCHNSLGSGQITYSLHGKRRALPRLMPGASIAPSMDRRAFVTGLGAVLAAPLGAETFSGSCQAICC